jgi:hypothetical protein
MAKISFKTLSPCFALATVVKQETGSTAVAAFTLLPLSAERAEKAFGKIFRPSAENGWQAEPLPYSYCGEEGLCARGSRR